LAELVVEFPFTISSKVFFNEANNGLVSIVNLLTPLTEVHYLPSEIRIVLRL